MTAALTGRPLLALLLACYVAVVLLVARAVGANDRCPCSLRHDDDEVADDQHAKHMSALLEVDRLRVEVRRLQRALIDADVLTHCEDLCMVLCAGPCEGENAPDATTTDDAGRDPGAVLTGR